MKKMIDARGFSCPQPVMLASKAIKEGEFPVEVAVDTVTARENVMRMAVSAGYRVSIAEAGDEFVVTITK
jgi:tRNA 2-thiouridine synthesizing protein A